jgi:hypothetical protein
LNLKIETKTDNIALATVLNQFDFQIGEVCTGSTDAAKHSSIPISCEHKLDSAEPLRKKKSKHVSRASTGESIRLPDWWKTTFGGKHLPDFWHHTDGKLYENLSCEACDELSLWWEQRGVKTIDGNRPIYPRDSVLQLEKYFGGSHGCVRQVLISWWRDRDGNGKMGSSKKAKIQSWRERVELAREHITSQTPDISSVTDPMCYTPASQISVPVTPSTVSMASMIPMFSESSEHQNCGIGQQCEIDLQGAAQVNLDPQHQFVAVRAHSISSKSSDSNCNYPQQVPKLRLPIWWKKIFGGQHLPEIWPHSDGRTYEKLDGEACEELSRWWDERKEKEFSSKYPRDCVHQLEKYFGGSHGFLRQLVAAWRRDRDGQGKKGTANKAKVQFWRKMMEVSRCNVETECKGLNDRACEEETQIVVTAVAVAPIEPCSNVVPVILLDRHATVPDDGSVMARAIVHGASSVILQGNAQQHLFANRENADNFYSCQLGPMAVDSIGKESGGGQSCSSMPVAEAVLVDSGLTVNGEGAGNVTVPS